MAKDILFNLFWLFEKELSIVLILFLEKRLLFPSFKEFSSELEINEFLFWYMDEYDPSLLLEWGISVGTKFRFSKKRSLYDCLCLILLIVPSLNSINDDLLNDEFTDCEIIFFLDFFGSFLFFIYLYYLKINMIVKKSIKK